MNKITAAIITFNEESNIRDALESVKWVDEIVVVDSGSSDKTVEICRDYTDKIFLNPWPGHVQQKNFAIGKSSNEWILSIDADERVSSRLASEIKKELRSPSADAYRVSRRAFYLGRWIKFSGWYPDRKVRVFRKSRARWGGINPHDKVITRGPVKRLEGDLYHYTYRNISHNVQAINSFTDISSKEYLKKRKGSVIDMIVRPPMAFFKKFILKQGFRDGMPGFIIAVSTAYYVFLKYAKLWELKNAPSEENGKN